MVQGEELRKYLSDSERVRVMMVILTVPFFYYIPAANRAYASG